jgi:hypothetical protein
MKQMNTLRSFAAAACVLFTTSACDLVSISMKDSSQGGAQHGSMSITAIDPASGPLVGGNEIQITGAGFSQNSTVEIDGLECSYVQYVTPEFITCLTPQHPAGSAEVEVRDPVNGDTATLSDAYEYVENASTPDVAVSSVNPTSGAVAGGYSIQISGAGFQPGATVYMGDYVCSSPTVTDSTSLTCMVPSNVERKVDVRVYNPDQSTAILRKAFEYSSGVITYALLKKVVLGTYCINCHGQSSQSGGVRLDTYAGAKNLVSTGTPEQSILYTVVKPNAQGQARMPEGDSPLAPEEQNAILKWIQAGTPQ